MKIHTTLFLALLFFVLGGFVTEVFADQTNVTITSVRTIVSNPGYISNAGKTNIVVSGTAPSGSVVVATLTDSTNPANIIISSKMLPVGVTSYDIDFNGTFATPQALQDGLIYVSVYKVASIYDSAVIGTPANTTIIQQTTSPIIYIIGDNPFKCRVRSVCPDLGAVAFDSFGNKLTVAVTSNNVRTNMEGDYIIRYSTVDFAGNEAATMRRVNISTRISGLSTTTPDMTNIPTGLIMATSTVPIVESIPTVVEPTLVVETIPIIKTSGIAETIRRQLLIGVSGEDIKLLQTLLSKDSVIYPEGLITGYFGNLTRMAVQRFQEKYGIALQGNAGYGQVGPRTKVKLIELFGM